MQIISGKDRGKKLMNIFNDTTRPTTGRVRENVFNIIAERIRDATVLDPFAGTGANAAECISRGAKTVIVNDSNPVAVDAINKNMKSIGGPAATQMDAIDLIHKLRDMKFDIVFLDPPYDGNMGPRIIELLTKFDMVRNGGVIVFETDSAHEPITFDHYNVREKTYGRAKIYFLHKPN